MEEIENIKRQLSINFRDDEEVLKDILDEMYSVALNISHREETEDNKKVLFPYVKEATISEYLRRGNEGMQSRNEGSVSTTYADIVDRMRNDIVKNGLRRLYWNVAKRFN